MLCAMLCVFVCVLCLFACVQLPGYKRLVYVSCNPTSQQRDVKYLCDDGTFRVVYVQPIDMFPQTVHLECIVVLERVASA